MASSTPGDNDPYLAELRRLAAKTALPSNLEESTALLSLLPDSLIPATRPIPDRARVLLRVFREVIGRAFTALRADHNDLYAGRVLSCKVYAPTMGSVSPAGYWYRLASAPYDNKDYGIANTYLNGDPVVGTSNAPQINVDRKVPDCPR
jgi:hypothetical protein